MITKCRAKKTRKPKVLIQQAYRLFKMIMDKDKKSL